MASPHLSDAEVDDLCAGLKQNAAKCRFLEEALRVPVRRKPNGRPLVLRADIERLSGAPAAEPEGRGSLPASNEPKWQRKAAHA